MCSRFRRLATIVSNIAIHSHSSIRRFGQREAPQFASEVHRHRFRRLITAPITTICSGNGLLLLRKEPPHLASQANWFRFGRIITAAPSAARISAIDGTGKESASIASEARQGEATVVPAAAVFTFARDGVGRRSLRHGEEPLGVAPETTQPAPVELRLLQGLCRLLYLIFSKLRSWLPSSFKPPMRMPPHPSSLAGWGSSSSLAATRRNSRSASRWQCTHRS
mmetsp:Transcript_32054/g.77510  ORF Transcript_32054/g.77510 Transcript_32054/m.77510 type:complete len:223 (-) Transcript_32054:409-1077(-)